MQQKDTGLVYCFLSVFSGERRLQAKHTSPSTFNINTVLSVWNSLPDNVINADRLYAFMKHSNTYIHP